MPTRAPGNFKLAPTLSGSVFEYQLVVELVRTTLKTTDKLHFHFEWHSLGIVNPSNVLIMLSEDNTVDTVHFHHNNYLRIFIDRISLTSASFSHHPS
jgi:hypothetical protein